MNALRALNLAQHWLLERASEEGARYIRSITSGPLTTTIAPKPVSPDGRRRPPVPWWWGNDEDASASTFSAMSAMRRA